LEFIRRDAPFAAPGNDVAQIMQHVRRGRIKELHNLRHGFAEMLEIEVSDNSKIVNTPVAELDLPNEVIVGALLREGEIIFPDAEEVVRSGDHVIVLASQKQALNVEKMFSVQVDIF